MQAAVRPRVGVRRKGMRTKTQNLDLLQMLADIFSGQLPLFS